MALTIDYQVPFVAQGADQTCWYACAQMITRYWKFRVPLYSTGTQVDEPSTTAAINAKNTPLMGTASTINVTVGPALGYRLWTPGWKPEPSVLYKYLAQFGPLWYAGENVGFNGSVSGGHAVVLTGVSVDGASSYVTLHDPWPVGVGQEDALYPYDEFFKLLPVICAMYPPPERALAPMVVDATTKAWNYLLGRREHAVRVRR